MPRNRVAVVTPAVIPHGVQAFNITSAFNGGNNFQYDENPTTTTPPSAHILRNNISYSGTVTINAGNTTDHNTFAGPGGTPAGLGASASDFVSTTDPVATGGSYHPAGTVGDRSGTTTPIHATGLAVGARQADGSLPNIDFLRLAAGSHLIDAGVNVGLPYNGLAPDLGWLETIPPAPALPGDYNGDHVVDAADYTVWRDNLNTSVDVAERRDARHRSTPATTTSGRCTIGEQSGGGSLAQSAVPEPGSAAMLLRPLPCCWESAAAMSSARRISMHGRG